MPEKKSNNNSTVKEDILLRTGCTIVYLMGKVGIFHFNKLLYLLEYHFIKKYGCRFTGEQFVKITHGPVVTNYKQKINYLFKSGYVTTDIETLKMKRRLEDDKAASRIPICSNDNTENYLLDNPIAFNLLRNIVDKYGGLPVDDLERIVYSTEPVINYVDAAAFSPFVKEKGGYVLKSPHIKIREQKERIPEWKKMALKHMQKFPTVKDPQQMKEDYEDFKNLEYLRPHYD
ncbi:MAG: DUF4065 domain-containing protein [Ignavibacteriae bacterium]|nr:DUF4065 domain-containing protein [Ignavibacteriota bacterium]NOG97061.1 DUF4065 domain-containing protein [Ignavibacteriota bacterium]